ncbi:hypothetical protein FKM82_024129 [Ascaphus truei]
MEGFQKNSGKDSLVVTFCTTVSALWCNSGIIHILSENGVLDKSTTFRNAILPGLAAISLAFLIMGSVGAIHKQWPLSLMAFALGLANIHTIAMFHDDDFGSSATACNFMIVTVISIYLVADRFIPFSTLQRANPVDIKRTKLNFTHKTSNHLLVTGIIANMISSSVFSGQLVGMTSILFIGHVPWLWTAGLYQIAISIVSLRSQDILHATFFSFTAVLKFAEGYSLLYQPSQLNEPILPLSFMVIFTILFFALACVMFLRNVTDGLYTLLFAVYCVALSCHPDGISHSAPKAVNVTIFLASAVVAFKKLLVTNADVKVPVKKWAIQNIFSRLRLLKLRQERDRGFPYSPHINNRDAEIIAHAFNTLAAFSLTIEAHATDILVVVAGSVVHVSGLLSLSSGKTLESIAFMFDGITWVIWGAGRYCSLYGTIKGFNISVGIICSLLFNCFIILCTLMLSKAWFFNSLTFEVLLIGFLLQALDIIPVGYNIAVNVLFGVVSFYCFLATLFNCAVERPQLPCGKPFIKAKGFQLMGCNLVPLLSRKVTSIRKIAEIMNIGGVCGIPTDVGCVIAAACHCPDAVEKIYKIKMENADTEMSLLITSLTQLAPSKHLIGHMAWDFMQGLWPEPIGLILSKEGGWLDSLGLRNSCKLLGSSHSVTLYISDYTVTSYLTDMVGPIAVKPLGKGHIIPPSEIYTRLRGKVDGILLDLPYQENDDFTIVDCTKIERKVIDIMKVGSLSSTQVMDIFNTVLQDDDKSATVLGTQDM